MLDWRKLKRQTYESELKKKNSEMQNLSKMNLKDSIRVGMADLGNIHAKYGFVNQALSLWEKSFDSSSQIED